MLDFALGGELDFQIRTQLWLLIIDSLKGDLK